MEFNLILVLGLSFFAFSLGAPNCANPCADLWAAKNCNRVQYCIKNDWARLRPTGRTDSVCDICLRMVQEARTTLQSREVKEELKQVLEGSCKLLTLKPAVELCDKIVDEFALELVEILSSEMDPETVCTVAKLCNNDMLRTLQKNSKECTRCQKFMAASEEKMKSVSEREFEDGLVSLCRNTGSFTDACYSVGTMYSGLLYNHTRTALSAKPCEATLLCPSTSSEEPAGKEKSCSNTLTTPEKRICSMCGRVTRDVIEQFTRVKSVEDYQKNFIKMCASLKFPADFCSQSAKSMRMYHFLKENEGTLSRAFCSKTICPGKRSDEVPIWPLLPGERFPPSVEELEDVILRTLVDFVTEDGEEELAVDGEPETSEEEIPCEKSKDEKAASSLIDCQTCKLTLKKLIQVVGDEDVAKVPLDTLCSKLPTEMRSKCLSMVDVHDKEITEVLLRRLCVEGACVKMNYCPRGKEVPHHVASISYGDPLENPTFISPVLPAAFRESDCRMCKELSRVLSSYVSVNSSHINLNVACLMSKSLGECFRFRESYSPDISRAFAEYVSSEKVCSDIIPSCKSEEGYSVPKRESTNQCQNCQTWVEGVTSVLLDDKNLEMITATFELVCDKLAGTHKEECRDAIQQRSTEMLGNILKLLSPNEACANLNYCQRNEEESNGVSLAETNTTLEGRSDLEKVPCKFCLLAVKTLLDQLENNKTEEAIRKALKSLCHYFPEETRHTCENLIEEYTEDLVDMIIADFSPSEICIRLKICSPNNTISRGNEIPFVQTFDIGTNEVRDEQEDPLKKTSGYVSPVSEAEQARLLQQVHSAVQECAMCEALVQVISSHKKMLVKDYDFSGNSSIICKIVPRHRRKQCMSMVVSYGPSIVNLIVDKKVDPNDVCPELTLCDPRMHARVNLPVSLPEPDFPPRNDCFKGPSFWCANEENARKCGTYLHCREMVWKTVEPTK